MGKLTAPFYHQETAMKVRIVDTVLSGYTGMLYQFEFINGVSLTDLTEAQVAMIGAVLRVEDVESGQQVGAGVNAINARKVTLSDAQAKEKITADQSAADNASVIKAPGEISVEAIDVSGFVIIEGTSPVASPVASPVETAPAQTWTSDSLAAVADAKGIAGLREIAEPMGVKGRSINELIREILAAQAEK